jgi:predicted transcriptional regulator YdeE
MQTSIKELPSFKIIGLAVRTTNAEGKSQKDIGELWGRFIREGIFERIPDKIGSDVYCLYTDYEDGPNGHYTTIIGVQVSSLERVPEICIGKNIPASKYRVYKSQGKSPEVIMKTWKEIWNSDILRKFQTDFDIYDEKSQNSEDAEIMTYVSIL